jgi:copper transport protein
MALIAAMALACVPLFAGVASAHALLKSSDPKNGATLTKAPSQIVATFTEPPDPQLSYLHVLDSTGHQVDKAPTQAVPGEPLELRLALPPLPNGAYTVNWLTVSKTDGHQTSDTFVFGVGEAPPTTPQTGATVARTPSPSVASVVGKWGLYAGVAVLFAAGAVSLLVFGGAVPGGRRTVTIAWLVLALGFVLMVFAERSALGISLGTLFRSQTGRPLVDLGIAIAVAAAAVAFVAFRPGRAALVLLAAAGAAVILERVLGGHAAAPQSFRWFNIGDQWFHVLAVATWIGGLALLLIHLVRGGSGAEVRRFSWLAGITLAVVAMSGVFRAVDELGGWTAWRHLIDTSFGITLSLKVALFVVLVSLGAWNRYVNVPGVSPSVGSEQELPDGSGGTRTRSLRRAVTAELVIATGVFGLTGVLTGLPPAATAAAVSPATPSNVSVAGSDFATSIRVRLTVTPGTVGQNQFRASVLDYDTGKPVPATAVTLQLALPSHPEVSNTLNLKKSGPGIWSASGTQLSIEGRWNVTVLVQEPSTSVDVPLHVQTKTPPQQLSVVKGQNGLPDIYTVTFPNGDQIQMYVDPGTAGTNQFHITPFDPNGKELPLKSATAQATGPGGTPDLRTKRLDKVGHFVANTDLAAGNWTFNVTATTEDGTVLQAHFSQTIG